MTSREYILAPDPVTLPVSGQVVRELRERADGAPWKGFLVVTNDVAASVLHALRRAYQDGRDDCAADQAEAAGR